MRLLVLAAAILVSMLLVGCNARQMGETGPEVARRHDRVFRLNTEMLMSDIDRVLMLDEPSRLTDKRIP